MLLMPQGFDIEREIVDRPVELPAARNVRQFFELTDGEGVVKDAAERLTVTQSDDDTISIKIGKKDKGIALDEQLLHTMGHEFISVGDRLEALFEASRLDEVMAYLQTGQKMTLEAVNHQDVARELVGQELPNLSGGKT